MGEPVSGGNLSRQKGSPSPRRVFDPKPPSSPRRVFDKDFGVHAVRVNVGAVRRRLAVESERPTLTGTL